MKMKSHITLTLNGESTEVAFAPYKTLLEVLREDLNLTGTKHGCELGECGTCAVLVDGRSILSCLMLGLEAEGRDVKTIEGMANGAELHPLQQTFADLGAAQCDYVRLRREPAGMFEVYGDLVPAFPRIHLDFNPDRRLLPARILYDENEVQVTDSGGVAWEQRPLDISDDGHWGRV